MGSIITKHIVNTDTLGILDLNGFYPLIENSIIYGINYPDFTIYFKIFNLMY